MKFIVMNSQSTANCNSGVLKLVPVRPEYAQSKVSLFFNHSHTLQPLGGTKWDSGSDFKLINASLTHYCII